MNLGTPSKTTEFIVEMIYQEACHNYGRRSIFGLCQDEGERGDASRAPRRASDLDIAFETKPLRQLCVSKTTATKKLGDRVANQLLNRIADLRAADSIHDLPVGLRPEVEGQCGEIRSINLSEDHKMTVAANHYKMPLTNQKVVDWTRVSRVKITSIGKEKST